MEKQEFFFSDNLQAVVWKPEGKPCAILQIAHGVTEHILRYEGLAQRLCQAGYLVVGHDHRGHGRSVHPGEPWYYFADWNQVVADIHTLGQQMRGEYLGIPTFLLGHSMGSFLSRTYLIQYPDVLSGCILMGTGNQSGFMIWGGKLVVAVRGGLFGMTTPSHLVETLAFAPYNRAFAPNRTPLDWLSVNPANVDAYIADPHCGGLPSPGLFGQMLRGMAFNQRISNLQKMRKNTPVLFLSGSQDPVGGFGTGVKKAEQQFRQVGMADVECVLYDGLRHELLQECQAAQIHQDIVRWLDEKRRA